MTRREQIEKAVFDIYNGEEDIADMGCAKFGRLCAEWADEHPICPWISVEQRLPPVKIRVLFLDKNGKVWLGRNTIAMQAELETDENNNLLPPPTVPPCKPVITHWMPIPKLY